MLIGAAKAVKEAEQVIQRRGFHTVAAASMLYRNGAVKVQSAVEIGPSQRKRAAYFRRDYVGP